MKNLVIDDPQWMMPLNVMLEQLSKQVQVTTGKASGERIPELCPKRKTNKFGHR